MIDMLLMGVGCVKLGVNVIERVNSFVGEFFESEAYMCFFLFIG